MFSEHGVHVSLDAIVEASGLSKGTLYRRYPDRIALLVALFNREVDAVCRFGDTLPPHEALMGMLGYVADTARRSPALADGWRMVPTHHPEYVQARDRLAERLAGPLEAAKASGLVRGDLAIGDLVLAFRLVAIPVMSAEGEALAERTLDLLLRGLLRHD